MAKLIVLLLIIAVIAALVWLLSGRGGRAHRHSRSSQARPVAGTHTATKLPPAASQLEKMREGRVFWGVSLQNPGCDAAMDLMDKEIPLADAPELPLPGCDAMQCNCSWKGLTERRHETRRTHHDRRDGVRYDENMNHTDRRSHKDRRNTDKTWERRDF